MIFRRNYDEKSFGTSRDFEFGRRWLRASDTDAVEYRSNHTCTCCCAGRSDATFLDASSRGNPSRAERYDLDSARRPGQVGLTYRKSVRHLSETARNVKYLEVEVSRT